MRPAEPRQQRCLNDRDPSTPGEESQGHGQVASAKKDDFACGQPLADAITPLGPAMDAGVTVEQIQDILIAVAPIVGTPRTMDAALNVAEALGIVIAVLEDELDAEEEAQ